MDETADGRSGLFGDFVARFAGRFGRVEPRRRMVSYLRGLLSEAERKNGWTLAEAADDTGPQGMQRLLNHYLWDADALRDDVRDVVVEQIGDPGWGTLILDETGFLKKGVHLVGAPVEEPEHRRVDVGGEHRRAALPL
ncbi:transposase, partial [Streptomyces hundungensis]|uniref:transposase n=1 Tax=Streptomyces hundungensis TaxID=1077946 RepID=UPI003F5422AD